MCLEKLAIVLFVFLKDFWRVLAFQPYSLAVCVVVLVAFTFDSHSDHPLKLQIIDRLKDFAVKWFLDD